MSDSILDSVKLACGLLPSDDTFDDVLVMHTNAALANLNDVGVGPVEGFEIVNSVATWSDFLGTNKRLNKVTTYVCLHVRMLFDMPATSYAINAMEEQIREALWRAKVSVDQAEIEAEPTV